MADGDHHNVCELTSSSSESSMEEDSINSALSSSCSTDFAEEASSHANEGPLYELSDLTAQLPIKRGLSKFYKGKSQSYTSLASVKNIEDLAKKVSPHNKLRSKLKSCKSYGVLDSHKYSFNPKPIISKKPSSRGSFILSSFGNKRASFVADCWP